jgi:outer membrane protein assembly factor BamB
MPNPRMRLPGRRVCIAVAALIVVLGVAAAVLVLHSPQNVSHPKLSFSAPHKPPTAPKHAVKAFQWPVFGYDAQRTRFLDVGIGPPFRRGWRFFDGALLEFPPVIDGNRLFVIDDDGMARAINARNGHVLWAHKLGTLAAASPAIDRRDGLVVFTLLSRSHGPDPQPGNGAVTSVSMNTGRIRWSRTLRPGSESSPLVWGRTVYLGDQGGAVYSIDDRSGHINWTFHAGGAVKGGIARNNGILYFGDYSGHLHALRASNGQQLWSASPNGAAFGFGAGTFYSTPAVAFGRVYIGNTDGYVYSFAARSGQLAWARGTGAYVYASPAVADVPGAGPTVYIGSYSGELYALNAASGAVRWAHQSGGRISGSATVIGHVVYFSTLGTRVTTGLDARSGRVVFSYPDGAFTPAVANFGALFMDGYNTLYEFVPRHVAHSQPKSARPPRHPKQTARHAPRGALAHHKHAAKRQH